MLVNCFPLNYFVRLKTGKIILWCYLIWYVVTLYNYFDPAPVIWLNSLGISMVIGFALLLSINNPEAKPTDPWQTFRLFMMPFGVSSFSSLIKGHGFILIAPPVFTEFAFSAGTCLAFVVFVYVFKLVDRRRH